MKPNPIDFDKVWYAFADIHNNVAVLVSIVSVFLLYLLVIIWARRADRKDHTSQVKSVQLSRHWICYQRMKLRLLVNLIIRYN